MRSHPFFKLLLSALVFLAVAGAAQAQSDRLPLPRTTSSSQQFLGSYVEPQNISQYCSQMQQYNVRFTWMAIPWIGIEPMKDVFNWKNIDPIVNGASNCGLDIGFHILAVSSWATPPPPTTNSRFTPSMPPYDMQDYYKFVFQLASHFKGKVSRYSIENEAHATENWPSSPESYFQLLQTGYAAVKAADPQALVEDAALSSSALGLLVINQMVNQGQQQAAVDFATRYFAHYPTAGGDPIVIQDPRQLTVILAQPEAQRLLKWAPLLFQNHAYYDVEQIHYFGPWDQLSAITDYVHAQLKAQGDDKKLDFWEMGYGWNDMTTYNATAHARDEVKLFATALGEGGIRALNWQLTDYAISEGHPGLLSSSGPRPVARSFQIAGQKLNGATLGTRLQLGANVWGYKFSKSAGPLYVVWSAQPTKISLALGTGQALVTDINGGTTIVSPKAIPVSASPVFVEAK